MNAYEFRNALKALKADAEASGLDADNIIVGELPKQWDQKTKDGRLHFWTGQKWMPAHSNKYLCP